jgi:two-component system, chemotaxis family, protein-glutamate methylesterase/glutaminase
LSEKTILLVETDDILTGYLQDYLAENGARSVLLRTDSVHQAVQMLPRTPVDLLISHHGGPVGIDGLALLQEVRRMDLAVRVVLVAEEDAEEDRIVALSLGCTLYLPKPFSYERFSEIICNLLQPQQGFTGRVVGMRLEDVIQMFCYRKDSTLLTVLHGETKGLIYIHDGGIVHAECDSLTGVEAFYEIVGWGGGGFLSQIILKAPPKTVFIDWQSLLMEGMRQKDEIRHALAPLPTEEAGRTAGAMPTELAEASRKPVSPPVAAAEAKRIMIVDDSRFIRKIVQEILESDSSLSVAGYATNGQEAIAKIDELKPDLILLDWDMPIMKGSTTLMHIMIRSPCPVVVLSGFVGGVGANPFDLLCLGGVDFLRKPQNNWRMDGRADDMVRRIKDACGIRFDRIRRVRIPASLPESKQTNGYATPASLLAVFGSSMGGCTDLIRLVPMLPADLPAAVIVLHDMQKEAIGAFVDYLDRRSRTTVRSLEAGVPLVAGICYVHPATVRAELVRQGDHLTAVFAEGGTVQEVQEHFLSSAAKLLGRSLVAVLLSGSNGGRAGGLRAVKKAGGVTLIQDPASSTDPRAAEEAIQEGVVDYRASADNLAQTFENLINLVAKGNAARARQESTHER